MVDAKNPATGGDKEKITKSETSEVLLDPVVSESLPENREAVEEESVRPEEIEKAKQEIDKIALDDGLKMQSQSHAQDIKVLSEEEKIKHLLQVAKQKGVVYAVHVAKKMDDPYVLDMLHDSLAKDGYYKNFLK